MSTTPKTFDQLTLPVPVGWLDNSMINFVGAAQNGFRPNVVVTDRVVPQGTNLKSFASEQRKGVEAAGMDDLSFIEEGPVEVGDKKIHRLSFVWSQQTTKGEQLIRQDQYYVPHGERIATVTLSCLKDSHGAMVPIFDEIIEGLKAD